MHDGTTTMIVDDHSMAMCEEESTTLISAPIDPRLTVELDDKRRNSPFPIETKIPRHHDAHLCLN